MILNPNYIITGETNVSSDKGDDIESGSILLNQTTEYNSDSEKTIRSRKSILENFSNINEFIVKNTFRKGKKEEKGNNDYDIEIGPYIVKEIIKKVPKNKFMLLLEIISGIVLIFLLWLAYNFWIQEIKYEFEEKTNLRI